MDCARFDTLRLCMTACGRFDILRPYVMECCARFDTLPPHMTGVQAYYIWYTRSYMIPFLDRSDKLSVIMINYYAVFKVVPKIFLKLK